MTFNKQQFSEDLFMLRNSKGLSRAAAADQIGIHSSTLQGFEVRDYEPQISNYIKVVKWMGKDFKDYIK
jgi:DNA-binding XRE family transcriptional regulator